ncbi:winged helix-turn-helix domain-containing protein [Amycolatopsis sp.]|uniref:winged helix-turn-helix domain-containing protein n=1 Tax=Amycolatopsis sp. TaxID=37632 RepID=UPI002C61ADDA|nr:winged helix-turn-helix domain-containing protein [Amycolatopsis sp.]HVV12466.1 winged helix-turn-helix domain-containing protein [Amycolatopsis sp.]
MYEQMASHLGARIKSGELVPGQPLPSERRLAEEYDVSLGTARHATRLLRFRGLVVTIPARGTYVTRRRSLPTFSDIPTHLKEHRPCPDPLTRTTSSNTNAPTSY